MRPRLHFLAWKTFSEERLEQKHPQTLKKCSRRKIETDLDEHLYFRPKNTYQTSRASALHSQLVTIQTFPMWQFSSKLHKTVVIRSYVCRTALFRIAMKTFDPGASNGGSNVQIRHFGGNEGFWSRCNSGWTRISNLWRSNRTELIRTVLKTFEPSTSNDGSNFISRHFGANLSSFKVVRLPRIWNPCKVIRI